MHWYTCKSLLNTLGKAVEQLVRYLAKQEKASSTKSFNASAQSRGGWTCLL